MKKVGIFYGSSTGNCDLVARCIQKILGEHQADLHDIAYCDKGALGQYDNLIFGIPTWGTGEMQEDWLDFLHSIDYNSLKDKVVALFGLGDQRTYTDSFGDALGILYRLIKDKGCTITGNWPVEGYTFSHSLAAVNGEFVGLMLDEDTQPDLTRERVNRWVLTIITNFI